MRRPLFPANWDHTCLREAIADCASELYFSSVVTYVRSAMLGLLPEDVSFPHKVEGGGPARVHIALGARMGTKKWRPHDVTLYLDIDPDLGRVLQWAVH